MTPFQSEMLPVDSHSSSSSPALALRRNRHLQRPKRLSPIVSISEPPTSSMGTLVVSLPSGRVLDVAYSTQTTTTTPDQPPLEYFVNVGDILGEKLDGKGAQILTLQAFCGTPKPRMFARLKAGNITRPCSFVCDFAADPTNPSARIATIQVFGVHVAREPAAESCEFITRHNANCGLIYFDAAAVPFLCHFPSEKTGASLHSIVHKEDVIRIHDVHRELRAGKRVVRCGSLRFVAYDGRVWNVDSEFAAFINPWSNSVEMVVAKHRVIALVDQVCPADVLLPEAQCRENDMFTRSILEGPQESTPMQVEEKAAETTLVPPTAVSPPLTKTSGGSSPVQTPDLLLSYNQINCLENVHRLLKSQSAPGSRASQSTSTSASSAGRAAPLTRELLGEHDRLWQVEKTRSWTRRLQLKRANPSINLAAPPLKTARTEPTSPSAPMASNSPNLLNYIGLLLEQQRTLQPAPLSTLLNGLLAQSANWTSGGSTPSNL